jgi:probable FeS assembly SUF system protein SufT
MSDGTYIALTREITAIKIPEGAERTLPAGTNVIITQELGGTFTIMAPDFGGLFRIQGRDADAIGREVVEHVAADGTFEIGRVWEQLRQCYDPEIPVNIVDLGLIYDCALSPLGESNYKADVKMTLTAPGCGMGPTIAADARGKILTLEGIDEAEVELVWDPPWNQSMISEAGRMKLGLV